MVTRNLAGLTTLCCPNCKGDSFMFSGVQRGCDYAPDMELWTCERCHSTFSNKSLGLREWVIQDTRRVMA